MDIFSCIMLLGGLAFFLYGMNVMSSGLEKMAGGKLQKTLKKITENPFKSLLFGAGITIAIQSSSALTVMLVGLVNSGIMQFGQTIGVLMGSNIGTTLTAWLLSLVGIESDNVFIRLLKPENFSPIFALIGVLMLMTSKKEKKKNIGEIFVGFAVLMFGMNLMSDSVEPLADMPEFSGMLTAFKNPIVGVLVGAGFTGIIQSSAASVGILQALALTGSISYEMAIPIIMGQNIGTCVTALLSSIGVNKNAKRVAVVHMSFNIIGTVICLSAFCLANMLMDFKFMADPISPVGIAFVHTLFNVISTALLMPFARQLEKIACFIIPDGKKKEKYSIIDERLLNTPSVAIYECNSLSVKMAKQAKDTINSSISLLADYDEKRAEEILKNEDELDKYEDKLGTYLVRLSGKELSDTDSKQISKLLHTIGEFERIGDHAVNIFRVAKEMVEKEVSFSAEAAREVNILTDAIKEILDITMTAYMNNDLELAKKVEPLEQVIDGLITDVKTKHVERLQSGICTIQMGFILSDLLNNYSRVSDHCSNIAVALIEVQHNSFDTHRYLNKVKVSGEEFSENFREYDMKYSLR